MLFDQFFTTKEIRWEDHRFLLKSENDLKLLPHQIIYVEGAYHKKINKLLSQQYDTILSELKKVNPLADFIYMPVVDRQLGNSLLQELLSYYFPVIRTLRRASLHPTVPQTDSMSRILFATLPYEGVIHPGFFRYLEEDNEGGFVYEYVTLQEGSKKEINQQIDHYIESVSPLLKVLNLGSVSQESLSTYSSPKSSCTFPEKLQEIEQTERKEKKFSELYDRAISGLFDEMDCEQSIPSSEGILLIDQIKSAIQNAKELGFYDLLLKEIGELLFKNEEEKRFRPSRLFMSNDYRIFLPDFNQLEIEMTPLPKSLFILFLRHPEGISLKSLIDYKTELLEIYKLLSYRENYLDMIESINRMCNPLEGSINEKLSRVKEAFLKKMSMDTAKYYIIKGERGMDKKIEIDRKLITLPKAFEEVALTPLKSS